MRHRFLNRGMPAMVILLGLLFALIPTVGLSTANAAATSHPQPFAAVNPAITTTNPLTLYVTSGTAGQSIAETASGCGYVSSTGVSISIYSSLNSLVATPTTSNFSALGGGCFTFTFTIPSTLGSDTYTVYATGTNGNTDAGTFVIGSGSSQIATLVLSPSTIATGQSVTGTACGFPSNLSYLLVTVTGSLGAVTSASEPVSVYGSCYTVPIPSTGLSYGNYTVTVSNGSGTTAGASLYVSSTASGVTGTLTLSTSNTSAGALVTANGCGFTLGESLSLTISPYAYTTGATSVPLATTPTYTGSGTNGSACYTVQFSVPSTLSSGTYYVFLSGNSSGTVDSGSFYVTGTAATVASLTASPTSVAANGSVTLTGYGFSANSTVSITGLGAAQTVSAPSGTFTTTLTVPAGTAASVYTITAVDNTGYIATTTVTVTAPTSTIQVNPTSAQPGQIVTVTGSGFGPNEQISLSLGSLTTLQSSLNGTAQVFTAAADGTFTAQYNVQYVASGSYYILAQGLSTGDLASTPFSIVAGAATATTTPVPATATPVATPVLSLPSVSTASTTHYFASGYTGTVAGNGKAAFTEHLYFYNPGSSLSTVNTTYSVYNPATSTYTTVSETDTVGAGATVSRSVNSDAGNDRMVSATVTASSGIVAEEVIGRVSSTGQTLDTASSLGSPNTGTSWYLAEGYAGATFQEYITIYNPGNTAATARIQYLPSDASTPASVPETVPAHGQITVNVRSQYNQLVPHGSKNIGAQVTSNVPVAVDRAMYWGDGTGSAKYGSSLSPAIASGATTQYFALLPTSGGSQSFITVLNPNSSAATVSVQLLGSTGNSIQSVSATINANTRYTFVVPSIAPGAAGYISSTLNSNVPVVAEAALYIGGSPNVGQHPGTVAQGTSGLQVAARGAVDTGGGVVQVFNPGTSATRVQVTLGTSVVSDTTLAAGATETIQLSGGSSIQGVLVLSSSAVSSTLLNGGSSTGPIYGGSLSN